MLNKRREEREMKKLLAVLIMLLLWAGVVSATPFIVCDPEVVNVGASFQIVENESVIYDAPMEADGSIRYDIAGVATGDHHYEVRAYKDNGVWGVEYSTYVPFDYSRPVIAIGNIGGFRLVK